MHEAAAVARDGCNACASALAGVPYIIQTQFLRSNRSAATMSKQGRKTHPLASRIKRLMQADDDVGKIAQATPFLMGGRTICDLRCHRNEEVLL